MNPPHFEDLETVVNVRDYLLQSHCLNIVLTDQKLFRRPVNVILRWHPGRHKVTETNNLSTTRNMCWTHGAGFKKSNCKISSCDAQITLLTHLRHVIQRPCYSSWSIYLF